MRWRVLLVVSALSWSSVPAAASPPRDGLQDATVVGALQLLGLPRADWPDVRLGAPDGYVDREKDLAQFAAFRIRRGREVDPAIYLNPDHQFYREARSCGPELYPLFRLASVIWHELQHGVTGRGEATALAAQAAFLRQALIRIPAQRRGRAMAYIQALELAVPLARRWDASGEYPAMPR